MQTVRLFEGRETSRIAFGCGRLFGGAGRRQSWKLIETARGLGISHFDVAPAYGFGLAEDMLGEVIGNDPAATITTKVGISRPAAGNLKAAVRKRVLPLLKLAPKLKARLASRAGGPREIFPFTPAAVEEALRDSLRRLRRDRADIYLLHEPPVGVPSSELAAALNAFVSQGLVDKLGSGTGEELSALPNFGQVRQYRWHPDLPALTSDRSLHIVHGVLRGWLATAGDLLRAQGRDPRDQAALPAALVSMALSQNPGGMVIVSTNDPERLKDIVQGIDWSWQVG